MVLQKSDVSSISTVEDYEAKLKEYAERSLDSLKDSLTDISTDLADCAKTLRIKTVKDFTSSSPVENPVANVTITDKDQDQVTRLSPREELNKFIEFSN